MDKINKCYKIHLNISVIYNLNDLLAHICKIGNLTIIQDCIVVWLDDDKDKTHLNRCLKKCGITEFYCEPIEYENINKDGYFDYLSGWFLDNYKSFSMRKLEKEQQEALRTMYENVQKANASLDEAIASINKDRSETMASTTKELTEGGGLNG